MTLKTQNVAENKKYKYFRLWLHLNDYQFKTKYNYRSTYMNPITTTNQKPTIDTQKLKRKGHKNTTKETHHITKK